MEVTTALKNGNAKIIYLYIVADTAKPQKFYCDLIQTTNINRRCQATR